MKSISEIAKEIGVSRQSAYRKLKKIGLYAELQQGDTRLQQGDSRVTPRLQLNEEQEKALKSAFNEVLEENKVKTGLQQGDSRVTQKGDKVTVGLQQSDTKVTPELQQGDSSLDRLIEFLEQTNKERLATIEEQREIIKNLQESNQQQHKLLDQQQQLTLKTQQQLEKLQLEYKGATEEPRKEPTEEVQAGTTKNKKWKFWRRGK